MIKYKISKKGSYIRIVKQARRNFSWQSSKGFKVNSCDYPEIMYSSRGVYVCGRLEHLDKNKIFFTEESWLKDFREAIREYNSGISGDVTKEKKTCCIGLIVCKDCIKQEVSF